MIHKPLRGRESHRTAKQMFQFSSRRSYKHRTLSATILASIILWGPAVAGPAQSTGVAERPYLGWSSFSQQTISNNFLTQTNIQAQSDALLSSGLQSHGFTYINIDSGWQGSFDSNGRPTPNTGIFPDMAALITHIHSNGQKAGIYWTPGIPLQAIAANSLILGTNYHLKDILASPYTAGNALGVSSTSSSPSNYKIDFTKPGSQDYINSIVDLFASWGVDFIKLDAVSPGSNSLEVDNQPDVTAWAKAIAQNRHPIWLTVSWALDQDYLSTWVLYSNARRIDADIECEGNCSTMTNWALTSQRLYDVVQWENDAGPQGGWNDLGSLDVGNTDIDGLNSVEQQSAVTFWAMANAPMYLGGDLTKLDSTGKQLLTNDEVLAVDQSGHPANQIAGGVTPVWASDSGDGSYYIALFNLNAFPSPITIEWSRLGFKDAPNVRDLWNRIDLGRYNGKFSAVVLGHGVRLLKITTSEVTDKEDSLGYEAEFASLDGRAVLSTCKTCSGGNKAMKLGSGFSNNVTFNNVYVEKPATYRMEINSATSGPRDLFFQVNGGPFSSLKFGGGSFNLPSSTTVPVKLKEGYNTIQFGNPTSLAPDLDRIAIIGEGSALPPTSTAYEAEVATFSGMAIPSYCQYCSGGSVVGNLGGGSDNAVTFTNVSVTAAGLYQMEIDYLTNGLGSVFMSVNDGEQIELDLNGNSIGLPTSIVIPVQLKAGSNTIRFGNDNSEAPALDRIAISPTMEPVNLTTAILAQTGASIQRSWKLDMANSGESQAENAQINILSLTQASGHGTCQPRIIGRLPINVGNIKPHDHASVAVPIDFSKCSEDARFNVSIVFSSDDGAIVGDIMGSGVSK
jgi:alpha-galactosidase